MKTKLQVFYNEEANVNIRMEQIDNTPWFVAKDICDALGISKYRDAIVRLDEDERMSILVDTLGGKQSMTAVNESGLYLLIFQSRKPEARAFRKWVTNEILPAIRRTGVYKQLDEAHDRKKLPLPKYRPFYAEWRQRVSPYISKKEIEDIAGTFELTYGHVRKVYLGTSMSRSIIECLTESARYNREKGIVYPERKPAYEQMVIEWDENLTD